MKKKRNMKTNNTYLADYTYEGDRFGIYVYANTEERAREIIQAMRETLEYEGELISVYEQ